MTLLGREPPTPADQPRTWPANWDVAELPDGPWRVVDDLPDIDQYPQQPT